MSKPITEIIAEIRAAEANALIAPATSATWYYTAPVKLREMVLALCDSHDKLAHDNAALRTALIEYMSQIGQGYVAHGLPFSPSQEAADASARAILREQP